MKSENLLNQHAYVCTHFANYYVNIYNLLFRQFAILHISSRINHLSQVFICLKMVFIRKEISIQATNLDISMPSILRANELKPINFGFCMYAGAGCYPFLFLFYLVDKNRNGINFVPVIKATIVESRSRRMGNVLLSSMY